MDKEQRLTERAQELQEQRGYRGDGSAVDKTRKRARTRPGRTRRALKRSEGP